MEHDGALQKDKSASKNSYPCDQCRRRKVKCDNAAPCDRCIQSGLRCTRDIERKRRGPKKGSGSVLAKLREQTDQIPPQHGPGRQFALPPFLDPHSRATSEDGGFVSCGSSFGDDLGLTSHPVGFDPHSVSRLDAPITPTSGAGLQPFPPVSPAGYNSAFAWTARDVHSPVLYPSPGAGHRLSVHDLAHKLFDDSELPIPYQTGDSSGSTFPDLAPLISQTPPLRPSSIDAILSAAGRNVPSPSARSDPLPSQYETHESLLRPQVPIGTRAIQIELLAGEIGVSSALISQCVWQYFLRLYPIMPIIHRETFLRRLEQSGELSIDEKCLLLSLCAVTVKDAASTSDFGPSANKDLGLRFLSRVQELRQGITWIESATLTTIITSFFVALAYFEFKHYRSHSFYLREAIGMALEHGFDAAHSPSDANNIETICKRRTFAILFVTERGLAILRNKPILIPRLRGLPADYLEGEDPTILAGFQSLCRLFALLNEKFVELWRLSATDIDRSVNVGENIASIQHNLAGLSFETARLTDIQKADILITQQWLRLIFWQSSMRQGLVSSSSQDPIFGYEYPILIAGDLCEIMRRLPLNAVLVHGSGIFEKIFEVAYTLMDVLTIAKLSWSDSEELRYLFSCLSASPDSHNTYVRMLETKLNGDEQAKRSPEPINRQLQISDLTTGGGSRQRAFTG